MSSQPLLLGRRHLLGLAAAAAAAALAAPALALTPGAAIPGASGLVARVRRELDRLGPAIANRDVAGVADFASASSQPRFHLVDLATGSVTTLLVAHGRGSDPTHSGWVRRFSNDPGSAASSEGAFRTGELYVGAHGRSMRLAGLDATNSNAEARAIVVHGAWYVGPQVLHEHGQLGRSEGCFAFAPSEVDQVIARLGPGRLLLSTKL
ncbi:MAG: murein L,D-transpeptidase catalytic domain family protein [Phenylobacterium sp.]|nr:MAG: murein L,D-transpeptidase catalytic domain family protein [Phenylobacterium sp.]